MVQLWLQKAYGESPGEIRDNYTFCGDSPNDEPMFKFFPKACAVANIKDFLGNLNHLPTYVTSQRGGNGFCELAETLLLHR